jgi:acetylornithine aminotransferase
MNHLMQTYNRLPVRFVRGEGCWLFDREGKRYLDAIAGIAVSSLGHAHPNMVKNLQDQVEKLLHTSNLYQIELQEQLAEKLGHISGLDQAFFCNSGAEANEAAIKLARLWGQNKGIKEPAIIVAEGAFHGRTLGALAATNGRWHEGFSPLPGGFFRVPYDNLQAIEALADQKDIVAVLVEPIQGESGIRMPHLDYLANLRALCNRYGWLLMLDEVQTGVGRSGAWFVYQKRGIKPDVLTLAKGLGGGVPIGACLAQKEIAAVFTPGKHGSTFGGNPLACRAALTVLEVIEEEGLCANAHEMGMLLAASLQKELNSMPIADIRHEGLLLAIELEDEIVDLPLQALHEALLLNVTQKKVIRLLPPLILDATHAQLITEKIGILFAKYFRSKQ